MSEFPLVTNKDNNLDNTNAKRSTQNILNEKDYNSINLQTFIELLETPIKKRKPEELEILYNYLRSTDLLDILKKEKIPLLDINSLLKTFSQNLKIKTINKNNVLFRYDDNGDKFFIILNGKVSILIPKLKKISITGGAYFDYLVSLFISEEEYLLKNSIANNYPEIGFINFEDFVKYLEIYFKNLIIELANGNEDHFNWQNVLNLINKYRKDVTFLGIENEGDFRKVFKLDKKLNDLKIIGRNSLDKRGSLKSFKNDSDKNIISNFILANNSNNIENYDFKILNDIETILYELYFENDNYNTGSFKADSEFAYNYFYGENGKYESMKFSEELGEENLYEQFRFIFKYGSFRNYINNLLKLTNEENFFYLKHKHVREYGSPMETSNNQYKVYYYEKIRELSTGSFFGDFALESDNKKRTATIRAEQDCILGYIDQAIYDQYIFQENKKIKLKNIQFIHSISLFKGINQRTIERHYYGEFEIIELYKDQFIFKQADINEEINKNNMLFNRGKENFSKHEENNSKNGNDNLTNKDSHNEKHNKNTTNENNKNKEKNEKSNLENNSTQNNSNNHNSIITMNTNSNNITLFLLKSGTIDIYFFGNLKELQELLKILIDKLYIMEIIPRELYETILHKYLVFIDPNKKSKDFMNNFLTKRQYLLYTVNSSQLIGIELLFFDLPNIYLAKVKSDKLKGFSIEGKKLQAIIQANPQIKGIYEKLAKTKINSLISRLNTIKNSFLNIFEAKSKDYMMYKHLQDNLAKEIEKNLLSKCNENEYENENIEDINKEIIKDNSIEENNNSLRNSPKEEKKILKEFEEQKFNMSQIYNPANIKNIPFFDLHNFKKNAVKEFSEYINHFKVPNIKSINQINNPNGNYNNTSYENSVEKYVEDNKNGNLTDEDDKEDNKIDKKNNRNIVISYFKIAQNYNSDQKKIHQISLSPKMTKTAQSNFSSIKQNKSNKKCLIKNLEEVNNFPEDLNKQLEFQEGTDFESLLNRDDRPHNTNNFFFNNLKFKNENKQSFKKISKLQHKNLSVNAQNLININNDYNIFHEKNFIEFKTNFFEENKDSLFKNQQDSDQKSENLIRIDKKETRKISPDYSSDKFNFFNISSVKYIESRKDQNLKKLGGKIKNDIFRLSSVDFNRKESYNSVLYEVNSKKSYFKLVISSL